MQNWNNSMRQYKMRRKTILEDVAGEGFLSLPGKERIAVMAKKRTVKGGE